MTQHPPRPEQPPFGQAAPQPPPRKRGMPTWAIVLIAGVGSLVLLCGIGVIAVAALDGSQDVTATEPDETDQGRPSAEPEPITDDEDKPEPEPDEATVAIGFTATVTEGGRDIGTITVAEVERTTTPFDQWGREPRHGHFLIFTVELEAEATMDVFSDDFYIIARDGERIDEGNGNAWDAIDYDDSLGYAELDAGQHRSGLLAFDVAKPVGKLAYAPNYDGGPIVAWEFDKR